jgi:competence protein ComEC
MNPHRSLFSHYPLAQLATAFSAGICAANYLPVDLRFALIVGAVCFLVVSLVFVIRRWLSVAGMALLLAFFFSGVTLALFEQRTGQSSGIKKFLDQHAQSKPLTLTGVLDGPPEFARDKIYLSLRVERLAFDGTDLTTSGRVWLLAPFRTVQAAHEYAALQLRYGTRIRVTTTLDRIGNYRNPGVSMLSEYLDRRDYDANGLVKSAASIVRLEDTNVFKPLAALYEWRHRLQREIDARFDPETAGVLDAALLGNRYNLSRDAGERFREGGTFHVLVISGLHISFIGGVVFLAIRRLTRRRSLQFVLPTIVVWSYSLAVGAEASVLRAALMFTFAGFALIVFRQSTSVNALGGAALVLLVRSPKELFDPSFQLTFLSVLAILVIAWPLLLALSAIGAWHPTRTTPYPPACSGAVRSFCEILFWNEQKWQEELARSPHRYRLFKVRLGAWLKLHHVQRFLRYTFGAMIVSASVQLLLLPLMIVYFHRVSPASLVLNIVVSVLLAALVMVAMLALLISQFSVALSAPLFKLAYGIDWLMVHSVDPFANLGVASVRLPEYSGPAALLYALYYVPLLLLVITLSHWRPLASESERRCKWQRFVLPLSVAQVSFFILLIVHPFSSRADGKLRVDFLDVGQGDSALVTMPDGTTLLVDGGGRPSFANTTETSRRIGETVVSEYLWWRGLSEVDYVLATHADADHIDGLNDVLKNFSVRGALVARKPRDDSEFEKFSQTLTQTRTQLEVIQAGDVMRFGEVEVSVLWPPAEGGTSDNNESIVLQIKFGERSILLTGDIEKAAERDLLASQQLRTDVVKVPHHGSKTSSTHNFVLATKPAFAIVSVGRNSMFGHPHEEVVQRWQAAGATVLTTGEAGTITITTDGTDLSLKTFIGPQINTNEHK